jgi:hypothetical protein
MYLEEPLSKDEVSDCIYNKVEELGFSIEKEQVISFLDNFITKYNRLPNENEIKPIVLSYMKIYREEENFPESINQEDFNYGVLDKEIYENTVKPIDFSSSISNFDDKILIIPKPQGRRVCPICGPLNLYKIHEIIDKDDILCAYPKIYGKKYICDQCGIEWKEK